MTDQYCLIIRSTNSNPGPAWQGEISGHRRLVRRGHAFTGREGLSGDIRTGWYEPVEWLTVEEAAVLLKAAEWEDEASLIEGYEELLAREYSGSPDDFPGLAEHYPWLVELTEPTP